jgi:putative oxidoreductase
MKGEPTMIADAHLTSTDIQPVRISRPATAALAETRVALAATLLRLGLGSVLLAHGLLKVRVYTLPGTAGFFAQHGFPGWMAYPVAAGELLGGLALLLGVLVRPVSLLALPILIGAFAVSWPNGWVFTAAGGGWEFAAFLIAAAIVQSLLGPGTLALGPALGRQRPR